MEEEGKNEGLESIIYICARCGRELKPHDFELLHSIKCIYCGSKIIYKVRKPSVKKIKAI
ncbi:hypothetical protein [Fervidicoccus fontis]|uniref:hypothetical protein n=1 Tax=Fervidicoccus fontis TaxID=683846 RepID=UPI001B7FA80B|nr:hypothetical protein [Fervidicoccus fontis]